MKKEKENKKISINNLLALAHILDEYEEFNKRLKKFVSKKYNRDDIYKLFKTSNGEFTLSPKERNFYKENKDIMDIINKYSTSSDFINYIYSCDGSYSSLCDIEYFYNYLKSNKDKLENIINLIKKIQELGFGDIQLDEEETFKDEEYKFYLYRNDSIIYSMITDIKYLENMELISEYESNIIKYKTNGSNYCMVLPNRKDAKNWAGNEIILNNLLFDEACLPKSLKREDTIDKIVALKDTKKEETNSIRDLVNLGVKLFDFEKEYANLKYTVDSLENVKSKEELKKVLENIKLELEKLRQINKNEVKENHSVTEEQIEAEKQQYIKNREFQYLDLD